jgi:hypothetical protein
MYDGDIWMGYFSSSGRSVRVEEKKVRVENEVVKHVSGFPMPVYRIERVIWVVDNETGEDIGTLDEVYPKAEDQIVVVSKENAVHITRSDVRYPCDEVYEYGQIVGFRGFAVC